MRDDDHPEMVLTRCIERSGDGLVFILQAIQAECNHLPEDVLRALARRTGIPLSEIYRTATFYSSFSFTPRGRHQVVVCAGTTCHVKGAGRVTEEISRCLGIRPGEVTGDGEWSLDTVNCIGCCALAPVMVIDGKYYGNLTPRETRKILRSLQRQAVAVGAAI